MSEERTIHVPYKSKPFKATLFDLGEHECTAFVVEDRGCIGVGLEGAGQSWHHANMMPSNPFDAFRAAELLSRCSKIEEGDVSRVYWLGSVAGYTQEFLERCSVVEIGARIKEIKAFIGSHTQTFKRLIDHVGSESCAEVAKMSIPKEIVDFAVDCMKGDVAVCREWVTDEIRAGTVQWSDVFADLGVEHPDMVDAREKRNTEIRARYEESLTGLLDFINEYRRRSGEEPLSKESNIWGYIEGAVVTAVGDRNLESELDARTITAIGYVVGSIACTESTHAYRSSSLPERLQLWQDDFTESIKDAAIWLAGEDVHEEDDLEEDTPLLEKIRMRLILLRDLIVKYFPEFKAKIPDLSNVLPRSR